MLKTVICAVLGMLISLSSIAQVKVRKDDHFFKRKVVNRISFAEKMNKPLVHHEATFYSENEEHAEQNGIVASLINGLKAGKYQAYHPDSWDKKLNYDDLKVRMDEFDKALDFGGDGEANWDGTDNRDMEVFGTGEEEVWLDEENDEDESWEDDNWEDPIGDENGEDVLDQGEEISPQEMDLGPYEEVIHMVEDRIFDKNRSMMVNQIDFFEVIWVDPSGALPEKVLARFRWDDVYMQLKDTKWKSRFNDATGLSVAQALELRLFHGFLINVGGEGVRTLWESERRRHELIEFEHHLWSY
ncbi:MAG: hypothetical protein AAFY71_01960 [Bacteroidota bacterium]